MLTESFSIFPGIGPETERSLWRADVPDWETLLKDIAIAPIGSADRAEVKSAVSKAIRKLEARDFKYFSKLLGIAEAWRAFPQFSSKALYLDIETDGGKGPNSITVIGLYDGYDYVGLVKGKDLKRFPDLLAEAEMIVTFYGSGFDVPVLRTAFPEVHFDQIHLDLCPTLRKVGFKGGLKKIEQQLNINRSDDTAGLTGWDAVKLWNRYVTRKDERALEVLVDYNREDVVNLQVLADIAYDRHQRYAREPEAINFETSPNASTA